MGTLDGAYLPAPRAEHDAAGRHDRNAMATGARQMCVTEGRPTAEHMRPSLRSRPLDGWHALAGHGEWLDGQEQGGQFLVGIRGRLYVVGDDYQIGHTISGYAAVGSGYLVALGSLHSTARSPAGSRQRAVMALEAAAELTEGVRPPFTVVQSE